MILKSKNFESKFGVVEGDNELVKKRTKVPVKTDKESVDDIHTIEVFTVDIEKETHNIRISPEDEMKEIQEMIDTLERYNCIQ